MRERSVHNQHPDLHRLKDIVCEIPFSSFQIYDDGHVSNCCFSWLPKLVGNINHSSLLEIYRNETSCRIRKSVSDGTFDYCDVNVCPRLSEYLNTGKIEGSLFKRSTQPFDLDSTQRPQEKRTLEVFLNYDKSCNLQCPSCRGEKILYRLENLPPLLKKTHENSTNSILELLREGFKVVVNITGSGDPFASVLYWDFLKNLQPHPNLFLRLQTNGLLMNEDRLLPVIKKTTEFVNISVDAASEPTYNKVRKGGAFKKLIKNIRDFDEKVAGGDFPSLRGWQLNFIVQTDNFREIVPFTEWALSHHTVTNIWFNLIADWGHLSKIDFENKAIWRKDHPEHAEFLKTIQSPLLKHPKIQLGNVSTYV